MSTLEELIDSIDLPNPVTDEHGNGEDLASYVRRVAYIGALAGKQHAMTHQRPAIIRVPVPVPADPSAKRPDEVEQAVADALDLGSTEGES